jgi:hypothetical protein
MPPPLEVPLLVTITAPVVVPTGTVKTMVEGHQLPTVALVPWNVTLPLEPKLYPLMVSIVPTGPESGESSVMLGITVNGSVLLVPFEVRTATCTTPGVASPGTNTTMDVEVQLSTIAVVPPNITVPSSWLMLKLAPEIVTEVPATPELTESVETTGVGAEAGKESFATYASLDPFREVW